jgi:hypothetical protein
MSAQKVGRTACFPPVCCRGHARRGTFCSTRLFFRWHCEVQPFYLINSYCSLGHAS